MAFADTPSMAVFCDFENVAIGVRDANYEKFDIKPVLERLLLKGGIVVKKAYCDWERYKTFKATMHEANFELIEIPHVRQSGKNSADIRMVVDALDLCYTKAHVDTFVIISGDSDFSPLVSKLRENAKRVIGVGVKQSCSDLLISNCDEFIFYDDLVRDSQRAARREREPAASKRPSEEDKRKKEELEARKSKAIDLAVSTFDALVAERGDSGKIWASLLKEAIKRRKPDFNETYFGFRAFGNLLEEAQSRGFFVVGRDEKSGTWVHRGTRSEASLEAVSSPAGIPAASVSPSAAAPAAPDTAAPTDGDGAISAPAAAGDAAEARPARTTGTPRGRGRGGRSTGRAVSRTERAGASRPAAESADEPARETGREGGGEVVSEVVRDTVRVESHERAQENRQGASRQTARAGVPESAPAEARVAESGAVAGARPTSTVPAVASSGAENAVAAASTSANPASPVNLAATPSAAEFSPSDDAAAGRSAPRSGRRGGRGRRASGAGESVSAPAAEVSAAAPAPSQPPANSLAALLVERAAASTVASAAPTAGSSATGEAKKKAPARPRRPRAPKVAKDAA
ncbi:NYN domain-containing protein [Rhodocyclus tenuis]|uniref:NYN domain-containing protein n=2 Tax=Rhodocyclus TaxID=1064 RepID=A0A6L5JWJ9_RHOTE|nr:NYN domain-containing protein [Rhodocyclus gracilis]MQY51743.1 NYN domain-containing protein [Rhodocyclus gracilis]NJA88996.1 NYN domain-containing protein [Rhodocyclus gracilis]